MARLRQLRTKYLSWPRGRDQIPNLQPLHLTFPHLQIRRPNILSGLVAELLLSIADFLPPEDIYCLSLCNRRLLATFESWRKHEKLEKKIRLSFLNRLERDSPEYFTCYGCCVLHKYDNGAKNLGVSGPVVQQISLHRFSCMRTRNGQFIPEMAMSIYHRYLKSYAENEVCFIHLQLAMRRYHYGPQYGIHPSALHFTGVTVHIISTALHSFEAQMCIDFRSPVLCLRIQDIISVRHLRADQLVSDKDKQVPPQIYQICAHIGYDELLASIEEFVDIYCKRRTLPLLRTTFDKCNAEYQPELREYGKDNIAYMMTRWINIGPGRSPDDPQWKAHSLGAQDVPFILGIEHMLSSPRVLFEASTTTSLDRLSTQNLHYLTDRNYRSVMKQLHDSPPSWGLWNEPI